MRVRSNGLDNDLQLDLFQLGFSREGSAAPVALTWIGRRRAERSSKNDLNGVFASTGFPPCPFATNWSVDLPVAGFSATLATILMRDHDHSRPRADTQGWLKTTRRAEIPDLRTRNRDVTQERRGTRSDQGHE